MPSSEQKGKGVSPARAEGLQIAARVRTGCALVKSLLNLERDGAGALVEDRVLFVGALRVSLARL